MTTAVFSLCLMLIDTPEEQNKFQFIYNNFRDDMLKAAYSILKDFDLAEDAVQNAFIRIARVINRLDMSNNPRSFALTVVRNTSRDIAARNDMEYSDPDICSIAYDPEQNSPENVAEDNEYIEKVSRYVMSLKPIYSEIFVLRYVHRMKYSDISKVLNVDEPALRKRLERLKGMILDFLEEERE